MPQAVEVAAASTEQDLSTRAGRRVISVAAGVVLLGMLAFESVKSLIFPGVASWHSSWLTIGFSTLVATAVTAAAVGRMQRLNGREAVWLNQELLHDALTGLPNCTLFHCTALSMTTGETGPRRCHHRAGRRRGHRRGRDRHPGRRRAGVGGVGARRPHRRPHPLI
jgi:hypothetical protein